MKVGDVCVVERRYGFANRSTLPCQEAAITRITPKRVYLGNRWFAKDDPTRELKPKYLDYVTVVVEIR